MKVGKPCLRSPSLFKIKLNYVENVLRPSMSSLPSVRFSQKHPLPLSEPRASLFICWLTPCLGVSYFGALTSPWQGWTLAFFIYMYGVLTDNYPSQSRVLLLWQLFFSFNRGWKGAWQTFNFCISNMEESQNYWNREFLDHISRISSISDLAMNWVSRSKFQTSKTEIFVDST